MHRALRWTLIVVGVVALASGGASIYKDVEKQGLNRRRSTSIINAEVVREMKKMTALRQVRIQIDGKTVVAWETKDPALRSLGRWTDPKALLRRVYQVEHPEAVLMPDGPGRQWQATWRGRFTSSRQKSRKAA